MRKMDVYLCTSDLFLHNIHITTLHTNLRYTIKPTTHYYRNNLQKHFLFILEAEEKFCSNGKSTGIVASDLREYIRCKLTSSCKPCKLQYEPLCKPCKPMEEFPCSVIYNTVSNLLFMRPCPVWSGSVLDKLQTSPQHFDETLQYIYQQKEHGRRIAQDLSAFVM